jgi:D-alanyl-D-alanine carboxypeptidase
VNPNGLHDDEHYTTGYDLYLIFRELITHDEFSQIAGQSDYTIQYTDSEGNTIEESLSNSNQFINGEYPTPEGMTVLCGKTGTTNEAGYCLIIEAKDTEGADYIAVVCGAGSRPELYSLMSNELNLIPRE